MINHLYLSKKQLLSSRIIAVAALLLCGLSGCVTSGNSDDIATYLEETRRAATPDPEPIPEPIPYEVYSHTPTGKPNPFDPVRFKSDLEGVQNQEGAPDKNRPKQVLESFSLTEIQMVGMLKNQGASSALVRAGGKTYPIQVGEYMGQDFGQVIQISPDGLTLSEKVQDAENKWITRVTQVPLSEQK